MEGFSYGDSLCRRSMLFLKVSLLHGPRGIKVLSYLLVQFPGFVMTDARLCRDPSSCIYHGAHVGSRVAHIVHLPVTFCRSVPSP